MMIHGRQHDARMASDHGPTHPYWFVRLFRDWRSARRAKKVAAIKREELVRRAQRQKSRETR